VPVARLRHPSLTGDQRADHTGRLAGCQENSSSPCAPCRTPSFPCTPRHYSPGARDTF